jgi:hypothetical protein
LEIVSQTTPASEGAAIRFVTTDAPERAAPPLTIHDEMDEASGDGWAELQADGSLTGEICFHNGDESTFKARPW